MFIQTFTSLLLLIHIVPFRVPNVLLSILYLIIWYEFAACCRPTVILLSDDVDINSGPKPNSGQSFSIFYWNLNNILAHNYTKMFFWQLTFKFISKILFELTQLEQIHRWSKGRNTWLLCFALTIFPTLRDLSVSFFRTTLPLSEFDI